MNARKDEGMRMGDRELAEWRHPDAVPCAFCRDVIPPSESRLLLKAIPTLSFHVYFYAHYRCFDQATKMKFDEIVQSREARDGFYLSPTD